MYKKECVTIGLGVFEVLFTKSDFRRSFFFVLSRNTLNINIRRRVLSFSDCCTLEMIKFFSGSKIEFVFSGKQNCQSVNRDHGACREHETLVCLKEKTNTCYFSSGIKLFHKI